MPETILKQQQMLQGPSIDKDKQKHPDASAHGDYHILLWLTTFDLVELI